ncbi:MAG: hypothetical protein GY915_09585 [bacterium]|nr:hypothetical protein [bacterium]
MFFFFRVLRRILVNIFYRARLIGRDNIPTQGPALLISNHVSSMDRTLIESFLKRHVLFPSMESPLEIKKGLEEGKVVCLFPEGKITRSGHLNPFQKELGNILKNLKKEIPIIPIGLSGMWGGCFSKAPSNAPLLKGKFCRFRIPVKVLVGSPIPAKQASLPNLFQEVQKLMAEDEAMILDSEETLGFHFVRNGRRFFWRFSMADSTGRSLRFLQVLSGSILIAKRLKKSLKNEKNIGVLLPSCVPGALVNVALTLLGRVPVNLNFTVSKEVFDIPVINEVALLS